MTAIVIAYLLVWVPIVYAGHALGRRWGNPDAGFWLPALLGPLGLAVLVLVAISDNGPAS